MRELKEMVDIVDIKPKSPEEKQYLICVSGIGDTPNDWYIAHGRTDAYDYIKGMIENIDINSSFILVESEKLKTRKSIYTFMKYVEKFYEEDPFDIDDYVKGDWSESEFMKDNDIASEFSNNHNKLNMQDVMNGTTVFMKEDE